MSNYTLTCSDGNPQQIVNEGEEEVDSYPSHGLLGELNAGYHVHQVVLGNNKEEPPFMNHCSLVTEALESKVINKGIKRILRKKTLKSP